MVGWLTFFFRGCFNLIFKQMHLVTKILKMEGIFQPESCSKWSQYSLVGFGFAETNVGLYFSLYPNLIGSCRLVLLMGPLSKFPASTSEKKKCFFLFRPKWGGPGIFAANGESCHVFENICGYFFFPLGIFLRKIYSNFRGEYNKLRHSDIQT